MLLFQALRCDSTNSIFRGVNCASDAELSKFLESNTYFYVNDNKIDFDKLYEGG